jgi:hypothetical protein
MPFFYRNRIYLCLVNALGNPPPIKDIRSRVVLMAQGEVLEVGVGPGVNFVRYDPARVAKVYALEPWARLHPCRATMTRRGLLKPQATPGGDALGTRQYSLTSKVRRLLATARKHLQHIVAQ